MALIKQRQEAVRMREKGCSLNDICHELDLGKGTVFPWIRNIDVVVRRSPRSRENLLKGSAAMQKKYRKIREQHYQQAYEDAPTLFVDGEFRDLVILYICEGAKNTRSNIDFTEYF